MKKGIKFTLCILGTIVGLIAVRWGLISILKYYGLMFRSWVGTVFVAIMALLCLALSGGIVYTLVKMFLTSREHMRKKVLSAIGIIAVLLGTGVSGILAIFGWTFLYQPEHVVEKYNQKMVAYVNSFMELYVTYHKYKNFLVCGYEAIGEEWYGSGGYDPFECDLIPKPKTYKFYDIQGNLIAKKEIEQKGTQTNMEPAPPVSADSSAAEQSSVTEREKSKINKLDINVAETRENELIFTISIDDFISSYNSYYWKDHESLYLSPSSEWVRFTYDSTIHSNYETYYYRFSEDEKVWSLPTLSVYVPTNSDYIQEITLDFGDHGYTEPMYNLYKEICFYTLKVSFSDFEDDKIIELYNALYAKANDPACFVTDESEPAPKMLYFYNNIGLYPYYQTGISYICIIPITSQYVDKLASQGIKICDIDNEF